jgi:hypothetical protein
LEEDPRAEVEREEAGENCRWSIFDGREGAVRWSNKNKITTEITEVTETRESQAGTFLCALCDLRGEAFLITCMELEP